MDRIEKIKGILFAIISSATFGFIPLFCIPLLETGMGLNSICFYRFLISVFFIAPVLVVKKIGFAISLKKYLVLSLISVFYASTGVFLTGSYAYIPSGISTTIHFLYPVFVAIVMILFFKEKLSFAKMGAIVLAIAGVFYLCGGVAGFTSEDGINMKGFGLVMITVFTYGIYIIGVNKIPILSDINGLKMTFYVLLNSAILFFVYIYLSGDNIGPIQSSVQWWNLILLALIPTLISNVSLISYNVFLLS